MKESIETREGLTTGDNNKFLRLWHEVNINSVGFNIVSNYDSVKSEKKFFTYIKGGEFRKWWGNFEYVVNWFKNVDLNSLQEGIGNVQRVLGVVQDFSKKVFSKKQ